MAPQEMKGTITDIKKKITKGFPYYVLYCEIKDHNITVEYKVQISEIIRMRDSMNCSDISELIGKEMVLVKKAA